MDDQTTELLLRRIELLEQQVRSLLIRTGTYGPIDRRLRHPIGDGPLADGDHRSLRERLQVFNG